MTIAYFTVPEEPTDEAYRMEVVRSYGLGDGASQPNDEVLDKIVAAVAERFNAPIVLISIVGEDQQCFRSCIGLGVESTPRSISFCGHAILSAQPLIVPDTAEDPRFAGNPLVLGGPGIRFYAGAPLASPEGPMIGTLCVIDTAPRRMSASDVDDLVEWAGRVMARLERYRAR